MNKIELLIEILLDPSASIAERDDAAMDLSDYNCDLALNTLVQVAKNINEDTIILNSCGESIASIWVKRGVFDEKTYYILSNTARFGVYNYIESENPEWVSFYKLKS